MKRTPLYLLIPVLALAGCELLVDFDRTKIPTDAADGSIITPGNDGSVEPIDGASDDAATGDDAATDEDASTDASSETDSGANDGGTDDDASDGAPDDGGTDDDAGDSG